MSQTNDGGDVRAAAERCRDLLSDPKAFVDWENVSVDCVKDLAVIARHALTAAAEPGPVDVETLAKELRLAGDTSFIGGQCAAPTDWDDLAEHMRGYWLAVARRAARAAGPRWQDRPTVPGRYATETDGDHGNVYVDDPAEWHANFPRSFWYGPIPTPPEATNGNE